MRKALRIIVPITVIIAILAVGYYYISKTNTKIIKDDNGIHIEKYFTADNFEYNLSNREFVNLKENNKSTPYKYSELGIKFNIKNKEYIKRLIIYKNNIIIEPDTSALKDYTKSFNDGRIKHEYAKLEKVNNKFIVTESIQGNYLDLEKLNSYLADNVNNSGVTVELADYYEKVDTSVPTEEELKQEIEKINNTFVEYQNGFILGLSDLYEYLTLDNNSIIVNPDTIDDYKHKIDKTLEKELIEYDDIGRSREFITHDGQTITVSGGTYGNIFSSDEETEYLVELFNNFKNETNRLPIFKQKFPDEIDSTYVEVSISDQHLWYYVNGILSMESDIVTGTAGRHDTPKGVYYVSECINGKYLTGDTYRTWVNKWMRLTNSGVGLHDAGWRGSFGGNIYKSNGSHGCVNLPKSFAYKLYDAMAVKTPVIIY